MKDSWSLACAIDQQEVWHELVSAALYHLDIELGIVIPSCRCKPCSWWATKLTTQCLCCIFLPPAIRASQQLKDIAMVTSLGQILVCVCVCVCLLNVLSAIGYKIFFGNDPCSLFLSHTCSLALSPLIYLTFLSLSLSLSHSLTRSFSLCSTLRIATFLLGMLPCLLASMGKHKSSFWHHLIQMLHLK